MCETCARSAGTLLEFRKADDMQQRGRKKGKRSRGKERMGTVEIMTGWECHSLRSISVVKVGKVRVQ